MGNIFYGIKFDREAVSTNIAALSENILIFDFNLQIWNFHFCIAVSKYLQGNLLL